jgi:hypothetical protein
MTTLETSLAEAQVKERNHQLACIVQYYSGYRVKEVKTIKGQLHFFCHGLIHPYVIAYNSDKNQFIIRKSDSRGKIYFYRTISADSVTITNPLCFQLGSW